MSPRDPLGAVLAVLWALGHLAALLVLGAVATISQQDVAHASRGSVNAAVLPPDREFCPRPAVTPGEI